MNPAFGNQRAEMRFWNKTTESYVGHLVDATVADQ
jgi:hypothetical protein